MKIINDKPPVWDEVIENFTIKPNYTIFTFGDTIYNPGGFDIPDDVIAHEEVHGQQQNHSEDDARVWWDKYMHDPYFRMDQEARAYAVQYKYICKLVKDRNTRNKHLIRLAYQLASPMYGEVLFPGAAMMLIKKHL